MNSTQLLEAWSELDGVTEPADLRLWLKKWADGENHFVEYKQSLEKDPPWLVSGKKRTDSTKDQYSKFAKTICAFANGNGGIHLIGVREKSEWDGGLVVERKDDSDSLRHLIPGMFYRLYPRFDIKYNKSLGFTSILVMGNESIPLLVHGYDGYVGGFRRYGSSSMPITPEELHLSISGWNEQFTILKTRCNSLDPVYEFSSPSTAGITKSRFFLNTVPVSVMPTRSFGTFSRAVRQELQLRLPAYFRESPPQSGAAVYSILAGNRDCSIHIRVSAISTTSCVVEILSGGPGDFYQLQNRQMCMVGIYAATALLNSIEGAHQFAVQGFYSHDETTRSSLLEPAILQICLPYSTGGMFPALDHASDQFRTAGFIYESIASFLNFEPSDYRGRSQDSAAFARATSHTSPWDLL